MKKNKRKIMNEYGEDKDLLTIKEQIEGEEKTKKKEKKGITGFLKRLEKEGEISASGEVRRGDAKVEYGYSAKLGLEIKDFPLRRGFHPRQKELRWAKKWGKRKARWKARLKKKRR